MPRPKNQPKVPHARVMVVGVNPPFGIAPTAEHECDSLHISLDGSLTILTHDTNRDPIIEARYAVDEWMFIKNIAKK